MQSKVMDLLLKRCPDTSFTRVFLSKIRIKRILSYYIPRTEVEVGESSVEEKHRIVEKYVSMNWRGIEKTSKKADYVITNSNRYSNNDNKDSIKVDMLFKRLAYGFEPDEYLCYDLETKEPNEIANWVSDLDRYLYLFSVNSIKGSQVFNNKYQTYKKFSKFYKRNAIHVKTKSDYPEFERFIENHSEFVKKPVFAGMGRGIELVYSNAISPQSFFDNLVSQGEHIIEERIHQSDVMSKMNASSVNTVRCITLNTRDGIKILYTFLKVGRKGSFVDNGGAGGILAGIDENTGVIITHGYDEFMVEYVSHPDSQVVFKGYSFPRWDEMKSMCCQMADMMPSVRCIGWDVAFTNGGWVVVEGNGMTQFIGPQIIYRHGIKKELLQLLHNVDMICDLPKI